MKNQKWTLEHRRNSFKPLKVKLALKTPKQDFFESMLQNVAEVMRVDLKIISKLTGISNDRCNWYCIEVSGTFDDLYLAIVNWRELGVEKYVAISSQPLLK